MSQNLKGARDESAYVLDLIGKKTPDAARAEPRHRGRRCGTGPTTSTRRSSSTASPSRPTTRRSSGRTRARSSTTSRARSSSTCSGASASTSPGTGTRRSSRPSRSSSTGRRSTRRSSSIRCARTSRTWSSMITPGDLQYSFFTNSGTESIEACLKMAILTTGRHHFVGTIGAFHGKSLGSLGGTSKAVFREPFLPLKRWTHVPFGDVDALRMIVASGDFSGRQGRRRRHRADPGRGRHQRRPAGLPRGGAGDLRQVRRRAGLRRGPERHGPQRQDVLLRARRRRAGPDGPRQGLRRRRDADRRVRRHRRRPGSATSTTRSSTRRPSAATRCAARRRSRRSTCCSRRTSRSRPARRASTCCRG